MGERQWVWWMGWGRVASIWQRIRYVALGSECVLIVIAQLYHVPMRLGLAHMICTDIAQ